MISGEGVMISWTAAVKCLNLKVLQSALTGSQECGLLLYLINSLSCLASFRHRDRCLPCHNPPHHPACHHHSFTLLTSTFIYCNSPPLATGHPHPNPYSIQTVSKVRLFSQDQHTTFSIRQQLLYSRTKFNYFIVYYDSM